MAWCLIKRDADKFKEALKDGTINPVELSNMTSEQRNQFFKQFTSPENATEINALFESKLLLKNQKRGMITWAKRVTNMSQPAKRDMFSKIERIEDVLDPREEEQFLRDLASKRLGVGVTQEEAQNVAKLSRKISKAKEGMKDDFTFRSETARLNYGRAKVALANYINGLKQEANKKTLKDMAKDPVGTLSDVAGNAKSIRASMDNSAIFRQGLKTLWTNPGIWLRNARKSFSDIVRTFGKEEVMNELNADLLSRPNAINGNYNKMGLAIGTVEEEFPGSFAERIPGIRGFYKASENAFTAFVYKTRADVADIYINIAKASGVDTNSKKEMRSIGKLVNSLTGRGSVGKFEPAANVFNNVFWSPRKMKSDIDTLTVHALDKDFSSFARKEAAKNTLKIIMGTAAILAIANAIDDDSVEEDPRSSDFGKIRIGNTRFDVSAGMASIVTLAARLISGASKSSTTGKVTELNSDDFGAITKKDVIYNFLENKLSPAASVIKDLLEGKDFDGNKITTTKVLENLFVPLPIANSYQTYSEPDRANMLAIVLADALGIGTNTYAPQSNWNNSTSKTLQQFKESVGEEEFKKANDLFNRRYNDWVSRVTKTEEYRSLSEDAKKDLISKGKTQIQESVLKEYGFKYKTPPKSSEQRREESVIKDLIDLK